MGGGIARRGWDMARDTIAKIDGRTRWVADFEMVFLAEVLGVGLDALLPARTKTAEVKACLAKLEKKGG